METMYWTKINWLIDEIGYLPVSDEDGINFYYKGMHDFGLGLHDTDDYAWLNTLLRYDIGGENATEIIRWYYANMDMTVQDAVRIEDRDELYGVCQRLGLDIDFSQWPETEPEYIEYGFEEKGA
jgi:hypothetical protein